MSYKYWKMESDTGEELTVYADVRNKHIHSGSMDGTIAQWLGTARGGTWTMRKYSEQAKAPTGNNTLDLDDLYALVPD